MPDLYPVARGLVEAGLLGALSMLVYLQAYRWADWQLIPAQRRHRVLVVRRCAPLVVEVSLGVVVLGVVLGVTSAALAP